MIYRSVLPLVAVAFCFCTISSGASAQSVYGHELGIEDTRLQYEAVHGPDFGESVALDGSTLVVGSSNFTSSPDLGVIVYERQSNGEWVVEQVLQPSSPSEFDGFGEVVEIDGDVVAVRSRSVFSGAGGGRVHVFEKDPSGTWTERATLESPLTPNTVFFGEAFSVDEDRLAVACSADNRVFMFERSSSGSWNLAQAVFDPSGLVTSYVTMDDDVLAVTTRYTDPFFFGFATRVSIFERVWPGAWILTSSVSEPFPTDTGYGFALDFEGSTLLVGASGYPSSSGRRGAVYVYERKSIASWSFEQIVVPEISRDGDRFGSYIALDGSRFVASMPEAYTVASRSGGAVLFERDEAGTWRESIVLAPGRDGPNSPFQSVAEYGASVALNEGLVAVGAPNFPDSPGTTDGAVFLHEVASLYGDVAWVRTSTGGDQRLAIRPGTEHAGWPFVVIGSASGFGTSTPIPGSTLQLPFQIDGYTNFLLQTLGGGVITGFVGVLDQAGRGESNFVVPPATDPSLVGTELSHAAVLFDPTTAAVGFVTNPVAVQLVP